MSQQLPNKAKLSLKKKSALLPKGEEHNKVMQSHFAVDSWLPLGMGEI